MMFLTPEENAKSLVEQLGVAEGIRYAEEASRKRMEDAAHNERVADKWLAVAQLLREMN